MSLTPLNKRVLVKRTEQNNMSPGGIALLEENQKKQNTGQIVSVSDDNTLGLSVGDTVLFGNYAGSEIEVLGKVVLILKEEELVAKIC